MNDVKRMWLKTAGSSPDRYVWMPQLTLDCARCDAGIHREFFATNNVSTSKLLISASAHGYANTNYIIDNIRYWAGYAVANPGEDFGNAGDYFSAVPESLVSAGVVTNAIHYYDGTETLINGVPMNLSHPTGWTNFAGYACWGFHSSLGSEYSYDGDVQWGTNSRWWIIMTIESFNGQRAHSGSGRFTLWLWNYTFGSNDYSNAPVGIVCHTDEPFLGNQNDAAKYFALWASGKNFAITAWKSRKTLYFQAIGDAFLTK